MKEDLAGGRLPSSRFGANAAWWGIMVLAFNLNSPDEAPGTTGGMGSQAAEGNPVWLH
jgi:hypothetical protein